ncbi:MAG: hypothetical protein ACR2QO_16075 [Acidimicrobiales bacterium]
MTTHPGWTLTAVIVLVGVALVVVGAMTLFVWSPPLPLLGFLERDLGGRDCGAPLDNPGWPTGSVCHGAVNRQTAVGWSFVAAGIAALAGAVILSQARSPGSHPR